MQRGDLSVCAILNGPARRDAPRRAPSEPPPQAACERPAAAASGLTMAARARRGRGVARARPSLAPKAPCEGVHGIATPHYHPDGCERLSQARPRRGDGRAKRGTSGARHRERRGTGTARPPAFQMKQEGCESPLVRPRTGQLWGERRFAGAGASRGVNLMRKERLSRGKGGKALLFHDTLRLTVFSSSRYTECIWQHCSMKEETMERDETSTITAKRHSTLRGRRERRNSGLPGSPNPALREEIYDDVPAAGFFPGGSRQASLLSQDFLASSHNPGPDPVSEGKRKGDCGGDRLEPGERGEGACDDGGGRGDLEQRRGDGGEGEAPFEPDCVGEQRGEVPEHGTGSGVDGCSGAIRGSLRGAGLFSAEVLPSASREPEHIILAELALWLGMRASVPTVGETMVFAVRLVEVLEHWGFPLSDIASGQCEVQPL